MSELDVNPAHQACMARFLRFTKYQRAQRLRSIDACFQDVKDTRLVEETYTSEEVTEMLDALADVVQAEVESELIHAARTNSLLLARLFQQAQKWHLELTVDTSDLENQELLEEIKKFEEQQLRVMDKSSPKKRTLAPLQEGDGPLGLLQAEIQRLSQENADLTAKLQQTESKVTEVTKGKTEMTLDLQAARDELNKLKKTVTSRPTTEEVTEEHAEKSQEVATSAAQFSKIAQLSDEVEKMRLQLASQKEVQEASEDQLAKDLTSSRQTLLQVKAQLQLAEKELERKFSQTGAYQNMKKMLYKKNEQIKAMRKKLETYEPNSDEVIDD